LRAAQDILTGARAAKILVVEDDPVAAALMRKVLEHQGLRTDHAKTGLEALEMHGNVAYRLVLSDWMMPEMSGVDLCREIRQLSGPYTYFVLCSSKGERADRVEAFDAGVDDFLAKPVDRDELHARLTVARRILAMEDNLQRQFGELERANEKVKAMNASLLLASKRFEELFNGLPVPCFTFDRDGLVHEWNRAAQAKFNIQPKEALQRPVWDVLNDGERPFWTRDVVDRVFSGSMPPSVDWSYRVGEGQLRYFACSLFCLEDNEGGPLGAISANLDITERELAERRIHLQMQQINEFAVKLEEQKRALVQANERLQHLAVTDGLTGLWNHRRFHEELERRMVEHRLTGRPLSLMLVDVDHFKSFNDSFGHQAGDDLLRQFARILKEQSRGTDFPARYGGEEFAMILNGAKEDSATETAERFRNAIQKEPWNSRAVTASFGLATLDDSIENPRELIERADQALYHGKSTGRNKVVHFASMGAEAKKADDTKAA
jgi:two-component system cell cycle response regulator